MLYRLPLSIVRIAVRSQCVSQPSNLNLVPERSSSNILLQLSKTRGWFSGSRLSICGAFCCRSACIPSVNEGWCLLAVVCDAVGSIICKFLCETGDAHPAGHRAGSGVCGAGSMSASLCGPIAGILCFRDGVCGAVARFAFVALASCTFCNSS